MKKLATKGEKINQQQKRGEKEAERSEIEEIEKEERVKLLHE